ncbi:MAG: hypothetical protein RBU30_21180, partial [Polyangia bacterium]|nr:hypothetical protein [Polyangia bacterium]
VQFLPAGRGASGHLVAVSLFAGTGSARLMVGGVGVFGERGVGGLRPLLAVWLWLPLLVWVWAPVLQRGRMVTVPEYLGRRFDGRVRRGAALALLVGLLGLAALELAAVGHTLRALTGQPALHFAALTALAVALWASFGGMRAVLLADLFLGLVILAVLGLLGWLAMGLVGPSELLSGAPASIRNLASGAAGQEAQGAALAIATDAAPIALAGLLGSQALSGRLAAARGERAAGRALILGLGPLGFLLFAGLATAGLAHLLLVDLGRVPSTDPAEAALAAVVGALGAPLTLGLLASLVLAAALSTLDALLVGVSALVVVDLAPSPQPIWRERPRRARLATLVAGAAALGLSALSDSLGIGLTEQGGILALVTAMPVGLLCLSGLFIRRLGPGTALGALLGAMAGTVAGLVLLWRPGEPRLPPEAALIGLGCGLVCLGVGFLRERRQPAPSRPDLTWGELGPAWPSATARLALSISASAEAPPASEAQPSPGALLKVRLHQSIRASNGWEPGCEVVILPASGAGLGLQAFRAELGRGSAKEGVIDIPAEGAEALGLGDGAEVIVTRVA